jgi:23S rRNA (guanine2445-N2)-methyltransferase / 23S rRNA (guanine2069-N7)-methyltransferase
MFEFLVTTAKGLDELLAAEVASICPDLDFKTKPGQLHFHGELQQAYRICLWSRLANRVLLKLAEGPANSAEDLYKIASSVQWSAQFDVSNTFVVDFNGTDQTINNSQFGALKIKDAIVDQFNEFFEQRPSVSKQNPDIRIQARLWRQHLAIYLDLSGQSLHQRHYRNKTGPAPIKEHIACAMLMRSGWYKDMAKPLIDPMCGSGTIVIEAALMAANIAPGLNRQRWGFNSWREHDASLWQKLLDEAQAAKVSSTTKIYANELERSILILAKENAQSAGVFAMLEFSCGDALSLQRPEDSIEGYIISNPPYGERLGELTQLIPVFQRWGVNLKQQFKGWHLSLLTANRDLLRQLKLIAKKEYKLINGTLECQLVNFELDEKNCVVKEAVEPSGDFSNRLAKNIKRLDSWLKTQNTNCYRIYDADLPEYNVAIDRYGDWLVVQEYSPPKDVPEHKASRRLHEVLSSLPQVTGVAANKIVLKTRSQQKGTAQYQKVSTSKETVEVFENGAKFQVNLRDYLDTGLFLDHRDTRLKIQKLAKGKDVLNLFAYTGSVSVHAALGGAASVTTVDMSNTYIEWAKENFNINGLEGAYEFVQADCLTWLEQHRQQYDLIFIDPPSFSNSKRMNTTWDVQRDHLKLLEDARKCLKPGGQIVFSNNLRSFKLDEPGLSTLGFKSQNITQQSIPKDFQRNPKIHHCWILSLEE